MAAFDDAFCDDTEITTYSGIGISATSAPTTTQCEVFARNRGAAIRLKLNTNGVTITVDIGANPVDITSDFGLAFRQLLTEANAVGAAIDQVRHHFRGVKPQKSSDKITELERRWRQLMVGEPGKDIPAELLAAAEALYAVATVVTAYSTGEVEEFAEKAGKEAPGILVSLTGEDDL